MRKAPEKKREDVDEAPRGRGASKNEEAGAGERRGKTVDVDADEGREAMLEELEELLDTFGDAYMNRHLVFVIVELVVLRMVPEMGERGVRELLEERVEE